MLLILFGLLKFFVFHEVELTSSATQRSLTGNSVHVFLFPLCYILFYNESWKRHQWLSIFFVLMIALGINFAGHRSGWIVFLFVLSVWYMQHPKKIEFAWIPLLGISIVAILVIAFFSTNIQTGTLYGDFLVRIHDIFSMENASTQERLGKWELSMDIINENPLLGLGRFPMYTSSAGEENQLLVSSLQSTLDRSPHNLIMAQAVHEGLLGLTVLAIFFYVIFSQIEKIRIANLKYHNFFKVYILSFIIFSLFNTSFNNPSGKIYFFISLGLLNSEIFQNKNYLAGNKRLGYDLFRKTLPSIPEG